MLNGQTDGFGSQKYQGMGQTGAGGRRGVLVLTVILQLAPQGPIEFSNPGTPGTSKP